MTITIFTLWISIILLYCAMATWKLFEKVDRKQWEALVPVYNILVWLKIIKRPWWWIIILLIPGFSQVLMFMSMNVSMGRMFGKYSVKDTLMQIFIPFIYFPMIAYGKEELVYEGETNWDNEKERKRRELADRVTLFLASFGIFNVLVLLFKITGSKDKKGQKTMIKEWGDSIVFALIAASLIRGYVLEAFTIPTPSMEKELLVGDFLFVNKLSYGTRVPLTPISYPLVHNTIPFTYVNSYSEAIKLPYYRLPGFGKVQRNDIVVFNHPVGDTAVFGRFPGSEGAGGELQGHNYFQFLRKGAVFSFLQDKRVTRYDLDYIKENYIQDFFANISKYEAKSRNNLLNNKLLLNSNPVSRNSKKGLIMSIYSINIEGYTHRPIDKKENYIKRCVAVAGDTLYIENGQLYINGKESNVGDNVNMTYRVYFNEPLSMKTKKEFKENYGFNVTVYPDVNELYLKGGVNPFKAYSINMSPNIKAKFIKDVNNGKYSTLKFTKEIELNLSEKENNLNSRLDSYINFYPNSADSSFNWNVDNYGPIWMPKKGSAIELNRHNWTLYKRCIVTYENNDAFEKNGEYFINGKKATTYTFKQNYYYMVGDNRHNSADSRMWGFVPEDHVVGKGLIIWMSKDQEKGWTDGGVRWNRIFRTL